MMAGHTLLKVIGGFVFVLGANSFIVGGVLPLAFLVADRLRNCYRFFTSICICNINLFIHQ